MKHVDHLKINDRFVGDSKYVANELIYIEQENLHSTDFKSADVFAFGICLLDLFTGKIIRRRYTS